MLDFYLGLQFQNPTSFFRKLLIGVFKKQTKPKETLFCSEWAIPQGFWVSEVFIRRQQIPSFYEMYLLSVIIFLDQRFLVTRNLFAVINALENIGARVNFRPQ